MYVFRFTQKYKARVIDFCVRYVLYRHKKSEQKNQSNVSYFSMETLVAMAHGGVKQDFTRSCDSGVQCGLCII